MNKYELMVLISPDIGGDAIQSRLEEIRKLITSQKGEIFFEDIWGLRDLAYNIKKHDRGYYAVFDFNLDGDLDEVDTTCRLENEILRHMLVRLPCAYEAKSLASMEEEEEKPLMEELKDAPERKSTKKPVKKVAPAPAEEEAGEIDEPKAEKAKEEKEEKEEKAVKAVKADEPKQPSLEDVDAKLKSIIDNPDLNF
ncbi:30S ribosomal protein S6 [Patescibacteria group bacterium]|nr:30S ribosomal protein S6 [Patescibacteria group bacterium]MBU1703578.1 30S ribosomal protein S6 [Patescibacteria group bacterium]MBU1954347.1 30S ribosomal protein S6 [Patescibacteria group bacterium]